MKTRKLTAILLALCMLLSLSISAFAADDAIASGTIPDGKITDNHVTTGNGGAIYVE